MFNELIEQIEQWYSNISMLKRNLKESDVLISRLIKSEYKQIQRLITKLEKYEQATV